MPSKDLVIVSQTQSTKDLGQTLKTSQYIAVHKRTQQFECLKCDEITGEESLKSKED